MLVLGQIKERWFGALRGNVGKVSIQERLDSEQKSWTSREAALKRTIARCDTWLMEALGPEKAKGFKDNLLAVETKENGKVE